MGIQKYFLESFTAGELMQFIDSYTQTHEVECLPGHSWEQCDLLARFLGFGYDRAWSSDELHTLSAYYPKLGAEETAKRLVLRSPADCIARARKMGLRTSVTMIQKKAGPWMLWEIEILEKYYPIIGSKTSILLPDRTESACMTKASKLDISNQNCGDWAESELDILKKYYPLVGLDVEDLLPGRSRKNIFRRANSMGLVSPTQWSEAEDELLRLHYPHMGKDAAKFFLGKRTQTACADRAKVLGLTYDYNRRPWSEAELSVLKNNYPEMGPKVSEQLPGRSAISCQKKAVKMGLSFRPSKVNRTGIVRRWSKQEVEVLRKNYPQMGPETCTLLPNRTKTACIQMAMSLGLDSGTKKWSTEEDAVLIEKYPDMGADVSTLLPGRTKSACHSRAKALRISRRGFRWTEEEDAILRKYYPLENEKAFQRLQHRSELACSARVKKLGLYRPKAASLDILSLPENEKTES